MEFSIPESTAFEKYSKVLLRKKVQEKYLNLFFYLKRIHYFLGHENKTLAKMMSSFYLNQLTQTYREMVQDFSQFKYLTDLNRSSNEQFALKKKLEKKFNLIISSIKKLRKQIVFFDIESKKIAELCQEKYFDL